MEEKGCGGGGLTGRGLLPECESQIEVSATSQRRLRHRLTEVFVVKYIRPMATPVEKGGRAWRKSRIAARLLFRKARGPLKPRDRALARKLGHDPEVENRLIQQALYFLGGARKHEVDRKLVARRD